MSFNLREAKETMTPVFHGYIRVAISPALVRFGQTPRISGIQKTKHFFTFAPKIVDAKLPYCKYWGQFGHRERRWLIAHGVREQKVFSPVGVDLPCSPSV